MGLVTKCYTSFDTAPSAATNGSFLVDLEIATGGKTDLILIAQRPQ